MLHRFTGTKRRLTDRIEVLSGDSDPPRFSPLFHRDVTCRQIGLAAPLQGVKLPNSLSSNYALSTECSALGAYTHDCILWA